MIDTVRLGITEMCVRLGIEIINNMTTKDAKRIGLSKMQMFRLKKKIKEENIKKKTANKLFRLVRENDYRRKNGYGRKTC